MIATGMLIQKIARQVHCVKKPPAIGPIAVKPPAIPKKIAIARPRSRTGKAPTTIPTAAGNINAAVTPWRTRKKMIQVWATLPLGVKPQHADANAKPITPITTILRRPATSASLPPNANNADSASR